MNAPIISTTTAQKDIEKMFFRHSREKKTIWIRIGHESGPLIFEPRTVRRTMDIC